MQEPYHDTLSQIERIISRPLDADSCIEVLNILGAPSCPRSAIEQIRLWHEYLPKNNETPYSDDQRYLHFLWDAFDRLILSVSIPLAVPYRRLLAKRLFKSCGLNFVSEEGVRFNFGNNLEIGNDVMFNRNSYFDTKGGISFGDFSAVAEKVTIFTHTHSESDHTKREYAPVRIEAFAKIYAGATILPGVIIGRQAIVAANSLVSHDVPPNTVVAGSPAKIIRERRNDGRNQADLNHYWLYDRAFQDQR